MCTTLINCNFLSTVHSPRQWLPHQPTSPHDSCSIPPTRSQPTCTQCQCCTHQAWHLPTPLRYTHITLQLFLLLLPPLPRLLVTWPRPLSRWRRLESTPPTRSAQSRLDSSSTSLECDTCCKIGGACKILPKLKLYIFRVCVMRVSCRFELSMLWGYYRGRGCGILSVCSLLWTVADKTSDSFHRKNKTAWLTGQTSDSFHRGSETAPQTDNTAEGFHRRNKTA